MTKKLIFVLLISAVLITTHGRTFKCDGTYANAQRIDNLANGQGFVCKCIDGYTLANDGIC